MKSAFQRPRPSFAIAATLCFLAGVPAGSQDSDDPLKATPLQNRQAETLMQYLRPGVTTTDARNKMLEAFASADHTKDNFVSEYDRDRGFSRHIARERARALAEIIPFDLNGDLEIS